MVEGGCALQIMEPGPAHRNGRSPSRQGLRIVL